MESPTAGRRLTCRSGHSVSVVTESESATTLTATSSSLTLALKPCHARKRMSDGEEDRQLCAHSAQAQDDGGTYRETPPYPQRAILPRSNTYILSLCRGVDR